MDLARTWRMLVFVLIIVMLATTTITPSSSSADAADYAIPNGHFYTQAAGANTPAGSGYAITDDGTDANGNPIRFWSEFQRLGSVAALGYPASRRFQWNGFTCQVLQRVILQWRPETKSVAFVNVLDLATLAGQDDYLLAARQTPHPADYSTEELGLSFQQIVAKRLALLDTNPAIKAKYLSVPDPVNYNGLPTAPVQDIGNVYVLRAQRVIIQQWKVNTPWAKAGDVTLALGGDLAKEIGLIAAQDAQAVVPVAPAEGTNNPPAGERWFGVNLDGGEISWLGWPGDYGTSYIYPSSAQLDYWAGKGVRLIRIPFRWYRVQPTLNGPLDATEMARLDTLIAQARARQMHVILDMHDYATWNRGNGQIGTAEVPVSDWVDVWTKLAQHYAGEGETIYAYELMNEPHDMENPWQPMLQAAINGIRAVDHNHAIMVMGICCTFGTSHWREYNEDLYKLSDPASNLIFDQHVYMDDYGGGSYDCGSFAQCGIPMDIGIIRVRPFVEWCHEHNVRCFIGEFGVPASDPDWLKVLDTFLQYLHDNGIRGIYWTAGNTDRDNGQWTGATYPLSIEPVNGQDRPQLPLLIKY